jgi:hypothetical protein
MKKFLLLTLLFCFVQTKAQTWVTIPDANFVTYLQSIIPAAMHNDSLDTSSSLVTTTTDTLNIFNHSISNLTGVQYFTSLTYLNCSGNGINNLPPLPNSIKFLECSGNHLTNISSLPNSLTFFGCANNFLTNLPFLPNTIQVLYCDVNFLTTLPTLPNALCSLSCATNSLTTLPTFPNTITYLNCSHNHLNNLPVLPYSLTTINCPNNNITCFPFFPNPNIYVGKLDMTNNPYNCLPNYIPAMGSDTLTYPLCATGNSNGCPVSVTSINQFSYTHTVNIYPNPANNKIIIDAADVVDVKLFDVLGKQITSTKTNEVDVSNFSDGVYFIQVQTKQNTATQKIIVQH